MEASEHRVYLLLPGRQEALYLVSIYSARESSLRSCILAPARGGCLPHIWIEYRSTGIPESQSCDIGFPPIPHFPYHSPIGVVRQPHVRLLQRLTHDYTTPGFDSIDGITTSMTPAQVGGFIGHRSLVSTALYRKSNCPPHCVPPSSLRNLGFSGFLPLVPMSQD